MEAWYIIIAVVAAGIGCFVYFRYFAERAKVDEDLDPTPIPDPSPESAPVILVDNRTIEQKYADKHDMWLCVYCETMNHYPAGAKRKKPANEPKKVAVDGARSSLRGDLLNRVNVSRNTLDVSEILACIACGKEQ